MRPVITSPFIRHITRYKPLHINIKGQLIYIDYDMSIAIDNSKIMRACDAGLVGIAEINNNMFVYLNRNTYISLHHRRS